MENFNDLKDVWLSAHTDALPDPDAMVRKIKSYRFAETVKIIALLGLALILIAIMMWVLLDYDSQLVSTRIGEGLMFISLFFLLRSGAKRLATARALKDLSNIGFLDYLKEEQMNLAKFKKRTQRVGFLLASCGLLLYIYEGIYQEPVSLLIGYALAAAWIATMWFIVRPLSMKRKERKLIERIEELKNITTQLNNNNNLQP